MKNFLLALALPFCLQAVSAAAASYQDLWWNAAESGWGINIVHQGDTLVGTWYIYDTDGKPMWLLGVLTQSGTASYSGTVHRYAGPGYNLAAFDPQSVAETGVGSAQFNVLGNARAAVTYVVNGETIVKNVVRQTYAAPPLNDVFIMAARRVRSGCADPSQNGTYYVYNRAFDFYLADGTLSVGYGSVDASNNFVMSCSAIGPVALTGSFAGFSAPFACTSGAAGTLTITDLQTTDAGLLGAVTWQYDAASGGCRYTDAVSGSRRQAVAF